MPWQTTSRNSRCRQRARNVALWHKAEAAASLIDVRCTSGSGPSVDVIPRFCVPFGW